MEFSGIVSSRSSRNLGGPPGEAEIMQLNPQREELLLSHTQWDSLYKGTLNLQVDCNVVKNLGLLTPNIIESGHSVNYPNPYENIPITRKAYWYYDAELTFNGKKEKVLIRRAENPLKGRIEVFAQIQLRMHFNLVDGSAVNCKILAI